MNIHDDPLPGELCPLAGERCLHPVLQYLARHSVELLTIMVLLFVLQTGLVPFDFGAESLRPGTHELFGRAVNRVTFPDIVSNIFLYVPVGILGYWTLSRAMRRRVFLWPATVVMAAGLSLGIEWIQSYSPSRVSSLIDLVSNVIGAAIGASLSWTARHLGPRLIGTALYEFHQRPRAGLLKAYGLILIVIALVPFSLSFDSTRLKQSIQSTVLIPFGSSLHVDHPSKAAPSPLQGETASGQGIMQYSMWKWQRMKRWSRWTGEWASFVVLAWLMHAVLQMDYAFSRRATALLVIWLGSVMAVGMSLLQLPVVSRTCDVTDVLFRWLGLWAGLFLRSIYLRNRDGTSQALTVQRVALLARIGCGAVVVYILYTGLIPLIFNATPVEPAVVSRNSSGFLPFFAYYMARFDLMMSDALQKFISYVLFAVLGTTGWRRLVHGEGKPNVGMIIIAGVVLSMFIELVQMFIPVRVTSLTDPILAASGCLTGVIGQQVAARFLRLTLIEGIPRPRRTMHEPTLSDLNPADSLLAGLTEPSPHAPIEPSP